MCVDCTSYGVLCDVDPEVHGRHEAAPPTKTQHHLHGIESTAFRKHIIKPT